MEDRPWLKFYDPGVPHHIDVPPLPLHRLLETSARDYGSRPCSIFKGRAVTYAEMDELTDRLAGGLTALGVKKGDPVGILMPNSAQFVMAFYGVLKAGGVVVATNPLYTAREVEYQLNDAGIEVMLVMSNFYGLVQAVRPRTRLRQIIVTNIKEYLPAHLRALFTLFKEKKGGHRASLSDEDVWLQDLLARHSRRDRPTLELGPEDVALFQYSGGTTGLSKAAVATHGNLVANTLQIHSWMTECRDGEEIVLMAIPMFHVYGMVAGMSFAVYSGASMVMVPNPRDLKDVLHSIDRYRPTVFPGVPTMYNAINNHPDVAAGKYTLTSIKACISGSAPLMRDTKDRFETLTGGKLVEGYGLSEAPTATHCNPLLGETRIGSIGLPFPDVDCRIVSLEDGATVLPPGQIGELALRSPNVMRGYHNNPSETVDALRGGWLFTGDIARMDEDGYFYIVDRKKELIKPGGFQVWPREVEEVIAENPKVMDVGVAGIPDAYRGETVKAWIVVRPGEALTEEEVRAWCKGRMASFKVPTQVEFRTELPRTTVGKILRRELVRQDRERLPA